MKTEPSAPPIARTDPVTTLLHGEELVDEYAWLKDPTRSDPEVLGYLEAENSYTDAALAHTKDLQEQLFEEMRARIKETDVSAPYPFDDWFYYQRTEEGLQYPILCRKHGSLEAEEQVILDQNALAAGYEQFVIGARAVSPDHSLLAYAVDTNGSEEYTLRIKDLSTGELLPDTIEGIEYSVVWANDNRTLFYSTRDAAKRPYRLWRHVLGTDQSADVIVHEETDEAFYLGAGASRSRRYIFLQLGSMVTTEIRALDANDPLGEFRVIQPRTPGVECSVEHQGGRFLFRINDEAKEFRLVEAPVEDPFVRRELIPGRDGVKIEDVDAFAEHLVITERERGLIKLRIEHVASGRVRYVDFPDATYVVYPGQNAMYDTRTLRFDYTSLVTPLSVFDEDMDGGERVLVKQQEVLGGYDPDAYTSERLWARAPDGVEVPISIVYKKGLPRDGSAPCWLYGYGSYGASMDPVFSPMRLSLLDRGFSFAIAHIRGGGELGESWRDDGKLARKMNTFTDFIACAEHLVAEGYTSSERLVINGGSAGGLLMGACVNLRPDLFGAVVAEVPFVDVINTVRDPSLLFSVLEHDEWGNPDDPEAYHWIRAYSPYENVEAKAYPHMLVLAGLNDPRVNYWEPAKWVARLRARKTDGNRLLLQTKMVQGHMGASGRYDRLREQAFKYAFVFDTLGIAD